MDTLPPRPKRGIRVDADIVAEIGAPAVPTWVQVCGRRSMKPGRLVP